MIFADENEYLIHLLYCALHDTVPENVPSHISLEKVFDIGKSHEVANIAYQAITKLEKPIVPELAEKWREYCLLAVRRDALQKKAREEILASLHSHGIYTLELQGTVVKRYYPKSHLRMMSDLDFVIPEDKLFDAENVMKMLGYETKLAHGDTEVQASKNQIYVELHIEFFPEYRAVSKALNDPFSHAELNEDFSATVTDTVFYLFHLLHTIKHANEYMGVGIRRIIDLYYLENAMKERADLAYIDEVLKENGFYETKQRLLAVKDHWFCSVKPTSRISHFEKEILSSGNHGTDALYDKNIYANMFANEKAEGKHFVKLRYILRFLFPKKEDVYSSYPFCKKHNYPAPLCWVHRFFASVFNVDKLKNAKKAFSRLCIRMK